MEGISSLLIALVILSIITEKTVSLVRSYPRTFVKTFILMFSLLILGFWIYSDVPKWLIVLHIGFYYFIFYNYNSLSSRYDKLTNGKKSNVHFINFGYAIVFHSIILLFLNLGSFTDEITFSLMNLSFFGLLTLFIQSLFHKDLLTNITKGKEATDENSKELEITFLSFLIGCIIASLFSANIFEMLRESLKSTSNIGDLFQFNANLFPFKLNLEASSFREFVKANDQFQLFTISNLGMLITGFFLSFGSKFFHELLDYVLEIKNLKRKLNSEETYKMDTIKDFDEYVQTSESVMAQKVCDELTEGLKLKHPNIISVQPGVSMIDGKKRNSIIIHLNNDHTEEMPKKLPYRMASGRIVDIPVEIVEDLGVAEAQNRPGARIANTNEPLNQGTYGCLVKHKNGNHYILTCSHVALSGSSKDLKGEVRDTNQSYRAFGVGKPFLIANELFYARRDRENDTALLKPKRDNNTNLNDGIEIGKERVLDKDLDPLEEVKFFGGKSGLQKGKIHQVSYPEEVTFRYGDRKKITYKNLILFGRLRGSNWKSISQKGDSGAVVFDKNNNAVGLLIGGNKKFSYALPITPILQKAQCTIET